MISRRTFFSITLMMAALFFLFQFSQVLKEQENDYDTNEYAGGIDIEMGDYWGPGGEYYASGDFVVFIGLEQGEFYNMVSQWCQYTKRNLLVFRTMIEFEAEDGILPEAVFVDAGRFSLWSDIPVIRNYAQKDGISFVLSNLPNASVLRQSAALMELLGIVDVVNEKKQLSGIHLFGGFLLGGEAIYEVKEENKELQDLSFVIPWYQIGYNTKTFMMGMLEEEEEEALGNEQLPAIIWRNSIGDGRIYAVNGNYMKGVLGMGLLSGIMADLKQYELYPVVNAQNVTIANLGGFSRENQELLNALYSRDQAGLIQNIVLPDMLAIMEQCSARPTYCLAPQYDYDDNVQPATDNYVYYMQQIKEQRGEAGWSLEAKPGTDFMKKVRADSTFRAMSGNQYSFSAYYMTQELLEGLPKAQEEKLFADMQTISLKREQDGGAQVLEFLDDQTTLQSVTSRAEKHSYMDDLRLKAVETALGYSNMLVDMNMVLWPESSDQQWEKVGEKIASNLYTYWKAYDGFEATTLSESDARFRRFMKMDYQCERQGDRIDIQISGVDGDVWFVLRTHGEEIKSADGASFKKLEKDAYLICAKKPQVTLNLRQVK